MFSYTMTGGIKLSGCSTPIKVSKRYPLKFAIGSKAYRKDKARNKGKLEAVVIKKANRVVSSPFVKGAYYEINYVDTFNRVWLENELVWQSEAISLATAYWERIASIAQNDIENS